MLRDLRAINKIIQRMGSLQPGIALPFLLPKEWYLLMIDFKDCSFIIPLHEHNKGTFAFSVPTFNRNCPINSYQWRVLPHGVLNTTSLCQYFVQQPLGIIHKQFSQSIMYHFMDKILLVGSDPNILEKKCLIK